MDHDALHRVAELSEGLRAIQTGWPFLLLELDRRIAMSTEALINVNNDELRGRIKALMQIRDLPTTLEEERKGLIAALSEQDAAS